MQPEQRIVKILQKYVPVLYDKKILELGCGIERYPGLCCMLKRKGVWVTGIDKHAYEIKDRNMDILCLDLLEIDKRLKKKRFDAIISNRLFAVLDDEEKSKVIDICKDHLLKGGIALHVTMNKYFPAALAKKKIEADLETIDIFHTYDDVAVFKKR